MKFWSLDKSMLLSRIMILLFGGALLLLNIFAEDVTLYLTSKLLGQNGIGLEEGFIFITTLYICSIPAYVMLYNLYRLIRNLEKGKVFISKNVSYLRRSSWCCGIVSVACLFGIGTYPSFFIITCAAGFMFLIIRIIKNVFQQAILMKDELDLTV